MGTVIDVSHVRKRYHSTVAVDDVSFTVERGEIFVMLGPNGAGKTTTVECVSGTRRPDGGDLRVLGLDPQRDRKELRLRVGVQLQESQLQDKLRLNKTDLFSSFYPRSLPTGGSWWTSWGWPDKPNTPLTRLSGGQKERTYIPLALVGKPGDYLLDELTTGVEHRPGAVPVTSSSRFRRAA